MSEVIRQRRAALGMSQGDLARAAGVDTRQIRRYEAGEQQPLLSVAMSIADALGISVSELAGRTPNRVTVTGDWWASWQTTRDGVEKIATQPVHMRQEGELVHIAATQRGLSADEGGYLWTGELRLWDNQVFTGWYAATDGAVRSKGTMFLVMHPHGIHLTGRWVGLGYDDQIMSGWASMGKTSADSTNAMFGLIENQGAESS
ncbi:helix-turn-helix transcriptional regulator [Pseudonocardia endophytica]|uniref:DNA-binding XRE family transcriptional regulator n=1 Tax=Pseudonocardia endophytica TaxID=401976 RepID=A0A4V2PHG7_PSEEN|nr:helix-turn-helix transcriptional regulator [Pseudonocardia endophytica]TCK20626.1 DNA-binding XRE family transcriptional regulator [Pseudonocardia endophytica]